MSSRRPTHRGPQLSLSASIDLDVEGGANARLDESYDAGWRTEDLPWSAKGPASSLPTLNAVHSAKAHLSWARDGWVDSMRWSEAARVIRRSPDVRNGLAKGSILSLAVVGAIFFFEIAFFPSHLFQRQQGESATGFGHVFFLYPLLGLCYFLAASWTVDVANAVYAIRRGNVGHLRGMSVGVADAVKLPAGTSRRILEESYRVILVLNYVLICYLLDLVPYIGRPLAFFFMSFIDAYYCFEQAWIARGWSLDRRMRYAESRWAYFVAFGLPSTLVSFFHPSPLLNVMLFMVCFPFCTVLAMLASPQPRVAPTGGSAMTPTSAGGAGMSGVAQLSRLLPPRLPIFWLTIHAHRLLLKAFPPPPERGYVPPVPNRWGNSRNATPASRMYGVGMGMDSTSSGVDGRRSAAQVVGGAWGAAPTAAAANGAATPAHANGASHFVAAPHVNGASHIPPPPKGPPRMTPGKKKE
ncbi:p53-mediated apoptosis protein EI24/PIG8 [Ceraceosorus bombacis]|uniref:p53-mediated apoptosis protein EI24/PIG8 n=1 Tax=Ceraceosorus bombacis TaxID=401625 RepID=A0A0N7L8Q9_9BASI|nr:p53-mediated apoptosis protein EI24/PIG8 [Ceraceosorus bombacis]